jgi:hypothetical protein
MLVFLLLRVMLTARIGRYGPSTAAVIVSEIRHRGEISRWLLISEIRYRGDYPAPIICCIWNASTTYLIASNIIRVYLGWGGGIVLVCGIVLVYPFSDP